MPSRACCALSRNGDLLRATALLQCLNWTIEADTAINLLCETAQAILALPLTADAEVRGVRGEDSPGGKTIGPAGHMTDTGLTAAAAACPSQELWQAALGSFPYDLDAERKKGAGIEFVGKSKQGAGQRQRPTRAWLATLARTLFTAPRHGPF